MEKAFIEEEVFEALPSFSGDKAPGPVSMAFWLISWEFVKIEMMNFFKDFYDFACFVRSLNLTFLVLILKKGGTEDLRDFKPISFVEGGCCTNG